MYKEIEKENCLDNHSYTTFGTKIMNPQWSWISSPLIFSSQHINFDRVNILSRALKGNHIFNHFLWRSPYDFWFYLKINLLLSYLQILKQATTWTEVITIWSYLVVLTTLKVTAIFAHTLKANIFCLG